MTDPYAPPTQQPAWNPYQPYGYGYGPPPPRKKNTLVIVIVSIGVALFVLLPVVVFALGGIVRTVSSSTSQQTVVGTGSFTISEDDRGPGFSVELPPDSQTLPRTGGDVRARFVSSGEFIEIRSEVGDAEDLSTLMDGALRDLGIDANDYDFRTRTVGGAPALMMKSQRTGVPRDRWVVVFASHGARWLVVYDGPQVDTVDEPFALSVVLGGWRW